MGSVMGMLPAMPNLVNNISCTSSSFTTGEHVYSLNVTSRTGVVLRTDNAATTTDTALVIRRSCGDIATEVACDDDGSGMSTTSYVRAVLDPGSYSVIVDAYRTAGPYQLDVSSFTPAANATCASAAPLSAGMTTMGNTANGGSTNSPCRTSTGTINGGFVYYSFSIPANSRVNFAVTATGAQSVRAYVTDSCTATTCAGSATTSTMGTPVNVGAANSTSSARTVILAIASTSLTTSADFTITPTVTMLAANASCSAPTALTVGGAPTTGDTALGGPPASSCTADAAQLFYTINIPANNRAIVTLAHMGSQSARVRVLDSCSGMTCPTSTTSTTMGATVAIENTGAMARTVTLAVASSSTTTPSAFSIAHTSNTPFAANASCAAPVTVMPGSMVTINTMASLGSRPFGCDTTDGDVLYYSVTVPATSSVPLSLTRSGSTNMRMRVLNNCMATTCSASIATSSATPVSTNLVNASTMARTFIVAVGASGSSTAVGEGTLAVGMPTPTPYAITTTPVACDDLSSGTALSISSADDALAPRTALPFAFQYFGASVVDYVASTNGWLQLLAMGATAASSSAATNVAIPNTGTPNAVVAPFWDDLVLPSTMSLRVATLGSMPTRRFVIEWNNATPFSGSGTIRFQAKLFEGSNQIEFHYCAISDTSIVRLTGSSATIGVENADGMAGVQYSFDTAGAINLMNAIRFTPNP
jgi:hypothetical protein